MIIFWFFVLVYLLYFLVLKSHQHYRSCLCSGSSEFLCFVVLKVSSCVYPVLLNLPFLLLLHFDFSRILVFLSFYVLYWLGETFNLLTKQILIKWSILLKERKLLKEKKRRRDWGSWSRRDIKFALIIRFWEWYFLLLQQFQTGLLDNLRFERKSSVFHYLI